ncbi:MAG TPA: hypothetical protein VFE62_04025 [Gemmataceae bacterium]|nr:hypothetical protein [Gemmataceae bacterium]
MRRVFAISSVFLLLSVLFLGCRRNAPQNAEEDKKSAVIDPVVKVVPPKDKVVVAPPKDKPETPSKKPAAQAPQTNEAYETAVSEGLTAMAARDWKAALAKFESAQELDDNEFVKSQIADLKGRVQQDLVAKNTAKDIETVLNDGKADDAAKLAADALKEFGGGDDADQLVALRLQAEAVKAAENGEKDDARFTRFRKEADVALEEKNLRAAALAIEQALLIRDDADLKKTHEDVRAKLDQYDALRKKANELRTDPQRLNDALAALNEAKAAWDTLQIRQDIDDCTLALQKRRDTVSVIDFEVRNDVGLANAGAVLADELFPLLQPKYDLVERGQLKKVLQELNFQAGIPDDAAQQKKIGKLANVRYLVVGSVSRLIGVSVRARLIDVETGLVVQTGKITTATMDEALDQMKDLARQLMRADDANLKADPNQGAVQPAVVQADAKLPAMDAKAPAPQLNVPAPQFVNANAQNFANVAPAPDAIAAPPQDPLALQQRNRLLYAAIEIGDFLFANNRYLEARQQFEFALQLAPDNLEVRARLERVTPLAPVVSLPPGQIVRPRLAVLPFMVVGKPAVVPPALNWWTPTNLGPYFTWYGYDVVDPSVLYWYMGRMGLTMNDVLVDPIARRWLARAIGVRYFVFGNCIETTSFDVNTYLIDTEMGTLNGSATINVQNWYELKLRLPELAQITMMSPAERAAYYAQQQRVEFFRLMDLGQFHMTNNEYRKAIDDFTRALQVYPNSVQAQVNLLVATVQARNQDAEIARRRQWEAEQAALVAARQRQIAMAQAAELARQRAIAEAKARTPAQQTAHVNFRFDARKTLIKQAQVSLQTKNFGISVSLFQSASNIAPPGAIVPPIDPQAFAQAKLQAQKAEQLRATQFTLARETALRQTRDKQLADAKIALEAEKVKTQADLDKLRSAQTERDVNLYKAGIKKGQELMAKKDYDAALAAFQGAQQLAQTAKQRDDVNLYLNIVVQRKAEQSNPGLAEKLAADSERRKKLEEEARGKDAKYQSALLAAQEALKAKKFDDAQAKYQEAGKLFDTDAVRTGLKTVQSARADYLASQQKSDADKKKSALLAQFLADSQSALMAKNYDAAEKALRSASMLDPNNPAVVQGLQDIASARRTAADSKKLLADYQAAMKAGEKSLVGKDYKAALASFQDALKLMPNDTKASQYAKQAQLGLDTLAKSAAGFKLAMDAGEKAMTQKKFDVAVKAFSDAIKLDPANVDARSQLKQAQQAFAQVQAEINYQKAITAGANAMSLKRYQDAVTSFGNALKYMPNDQKATQQLAQARQLLQDSMKTKKTPPPPPVDPNKGFNDAMKRGADAEKDMKYADAVKAFTEAIKLQPKNTDAHAGWKRNQFNLDVQQGQQYLDNMMWGNAQRSFEAALQLSPNNPSVLKLLQKAKNKGK